LIDECRGDKQFMSYFKPKTVILGDNLLPSDDESDDSWFTNDDDSDAMDSTSNISDSSDAGYGDDHDERDNVGEMDYCDDKHSLLMYAAGLIPEKHKKVKQQLELTADADLGPDFFDADTRYKSQFEERQREKERDYLLLRIHDAKIKKRYPQIEFPLADCRRTFQMDTALGKTRLSKPALLLPGFEQQMKKYPANPVDGD
ncbi:hypothetical protein BGZ65_007037, partial [Modicella reniformis]